MKTTANLIIVIVALLAARSASAAPSVELVWTATSGSGTVGTDTIVADVGDFLVLDIFVTDDCPDGLFAASVSLAWDPDVLLGLGGEDCPSPTNFAPGICSASGGGFFQPFVLGVDLAPGQALYFDAVSLNLLPGYVCSTMHLGRMDFFVANRASTEVVVDYQETDAIIDGPMVAHLPPATAFIERPPGCF